MPGAESSQHRLSTPCPLLSKNDERRIERRRRAETLQARTGRSCCVNFSRSAGCRRTGAFSFYSDLVAGLLIATVSGATGATAVLASPLTPARVDRPQATARPDSLHVCQLRIGGRTASTSGHLAPWTGRTGAPAWPGGQGPKGPERREGLPGLPRRRGWSSARQRGRRPAPRAECSRRSSAVACYSAGSASPSDHGRSGQVAEPRRTGSRPA